MKSLIKKIILKFAKHTRIYQERLERIEVARRQNDLLCLQAQERENIEERRSAPPDIQVVNLNANDICNSKCVMCNIWQQKQDFEISPDNLRGILTDPLFQNVKHIGVTGGEPTLREDLPELYEAIIDAIPNITGLSTITNCIKDKDVILRVDKVIKVVKSRSKNFAMMISLDGYQDVHDKIRGRPGNFESAMRVYKYFSGKGIDITIGSTISKGNVWEVDDLLDYMKENGIYGRFRVAEFIKRLYNGDRVDTIRNFDEDETYHLILFFYKLVFSFEKNETYQRTYKSIINILSGGERLIGCPYQEKGVVLNSRGELAYCAPKSEIIGNALAHSGKKLYLQNLQERERIYDFDCKDCIHDYHAPITYVEKKIDFDEWYWKKRINLSSILSRSELSKISPIKSDKKKMFITGWYGTETVGDKAILAGIIDELLEEYGNEVDIIITSLYPIITKRTVKELGINAIVIPVYSEGFVAHAKGSDLVIMGGGPLMDLEELALPLTAFKIAQAGRGKTIIYGCGLGPLTDEKFIIAAKEILQLADVIKLRDQKSIELARSWVGGKKPIELSGDPAKKYLRRYGPGEVDKRKILRCYLREWTYEYSRSISYEEFLVLKEKFEKALSNFIKRKASELGVGEIVFEHMHNFIVGNDDRDFSRYFIRKHFSAVEIPVSYNKYLSTVENTVTAMQSAVHNVCMRFHSVVFAHTLDTSFTAIDYTRGGKISNYLTDNHCPEHLKSIEMLISEFHEG